MLTLPELPPCPYHQDQPPKAIADCRICWQRFYLPFEHAPTLSRINHEIEQYRGQVARAKQYIALRAEGFETNIMAPKDAKVLFALPDGNMVVGREVGDYMGSTYPVADDAKTPIQAYLGWKHYVEN
jgi:hypothetical protein